MLEDIIAYISSLSPFWVYITLFFFSFIENVFPPSPSDVVVIFGASLITGGDQHIGFIPVLLITSLGSSAGFMLMYYVGMTLGEKAVRHKKLKFISPESIAKTDEWFKKYGYKLIIFNRFMPGTRSVISFFSGFSELDAKKTFIYATISAFAWNVIIIWLGVILGNNIEAIDKYLAIYSNAVIGLTLLAVLAIVIRQILLKQKRQKSES
ncbi:MAG: DedA family protein [Ignavibacteria bacterium]|jgi:membrane protein DedA with SNARE-associated domain|nr:DedA family protein [Ignavibacteria bacterium]MCU7522171.1 DedA family protein [Ignavibacteria bacterium]HEX2961466.1 DedA family protein [Ignavibacteriales bacterium]